jgi:hypothetical protein
MLTNTPQGTRLLILTPEKLRMIWGRMDGINGLFDDFAKGRPDIFLQGLLAPENVWLELEDGNGVLYATSVMPGLSAQVHFVYWDRKLSPRIALTNEGLVWLVERLNLQKINAVIPDFCKAALHFAKKLGFVHEGVVRRYSYSGGKLYNAVYLGMTREEVLDGSRLQMDGQPRQFGIQGIVRPDDEGLAEQLQQYSAGSEQPIYEQRDETDGGVRDEAGTVGTEYSWAAFVSGVGPQSHGIPESFGASSPTAT